MKKLLVLLPFLLISIQGFPKLSTKQLVGKWNYKVVTKAEELTGIFSFTEKEGILTGEVIGKDGSKFPFTKIEFKATNTLYLEVINNAAVVKITIKVAGNRFTGIGAYNQGEAPIFGKKIRD